MSLILLTIMLSFIHFIFLEDDNGQSSLANYLLERVSGFKVLSCNCWKVMQVWDKEYLDSLMTSCLNYYVCSCFSLGFEISFIFSTVSTCLFSKVTISIFILLQFVLDNSKIVFYLWRTFYFIFIILNCLDVI